MSEGLERAGEPWAFRVPVRVQVLSGSMIQVFELP